ncbi:hypothetical protein [Microbispora sp. H10949]|uniref:hypothetical protein n=1 Tax=Microbispora sp. H10949 TaxID=2729111 RepID=UPI001601E55C|nr:hypothetical protein [Microbispora sp. H10949]
MREGSSVATVNRKTTSWRERALATIDGLETELDRLNNDSAYARGVRRHLGAARGAATRLRNPMSVWTGSAVDRTWANIHQAEVELLRLVPPGELEWWGTNILARAKQHLGRNDPRRTKFESQLRRSDGKLAACDRGLAIQTMQAANIAAQLERVNLRSFRNIVLVTAIILALIAVSFMFLGILESDKLKLCYHPKEGLVCPLGGRPSVWDIPLVELIGLSGAALVGAATLRHIHGAATPYTLPIALALLKLPAGAVSAVLGLLLIQGGFIPGLTDLDTGGQILAWAAVFGIAQQVVTRVADEQARRVLENVRGPSYWGERTSRTVD